MSTSFGCQCEERAKPVDERNWWVRQYLCNHSAFSGYHYTRSDYSEVVCGTCHASGRTKASYVHRLRHQENPL